jgi:hypothetical protein
MSSTAQSGFRKVIARFINGARACGRVFSAGPESNIGGNLISGKIHFLRHSIAAPKSTARAFAAADLEKFYAGDHATGMAVAEHLSSLLRMSERSPA